MPAIPIVQVPQTEACARGCDVLAATAEAIGDSMPGPDAELFWEIAVGLRRQAATLRGGRPGERGRCAPSLRVVRG